jgi:Ca-activated chloride channel family protein
MPAAVGKILVVGIGDPRAGKFIDGHQSRQDVSTLRQVATRLQGVYHDGNQKHVPSSTIATLRLAHEEESWFRWGHRELALAAVGLGGLVVSLVPLLLHWFGTGWLPGVKNPHVYRKGVAIS